MFVLVKFAQLLFHNHKVICVILVLKHHKLGLAITKEIWGFGSLIDHLLHRVKMSDSHVGDLLIVATLNRLHLHTHEHQVEQLLHTGFIQPHNGRMRQLYKNLSRLIETVHRLWSENLAHELFTEHSFDNILQDFLTSVRSDVLRSETLVKDVNHLTSKIDDQVWQHMKIRRLLLNRVRHLKTIIIYS